MERLHYQAPGEEMRMSKLKVGDWIEVRSEQEILRTLDEHGQLDGVPFMPEMIAFCGRRFQIFKVAHKTCDSISQKTRRLQDTFHLTTRCSGETHGGCQARCLLFWKAAWLRPITAPDALPSSISEQPSPAARPTCTRADVESASRSELADGSVRYHCQATQIREATTPMAWWDLRQYVEDIRSGNVTVRQELLGIARLTLIRAGTLPFLVGRLFRLLYRGLVFFDERRPFPFLTGSVPNGVRTPSQSLTLAPKDTVCIRPYGEIIATLDTVGRNRGLTFDPEQVPYMGREYSVSHRIERIVDEGSGRLVQINSPTVALDGVTCQGKYSRCRLSCPRSAILFWREAWLERSSPSALPPSK